MTSWHCITTIFSSPTTYKLEPSVPHESLPSCIPIHTGWRVRIQYVPQRKRPVFLNASFASCCPDLHIVLKLLPVFLHNQGITWMWCASLIFDLIPDRCSFGAESSEATTPNFAKLPWWCFCAKVRLIFLVGCLEERCWDVRMALIRDLFEEQQRKMHC